MISRTGNVEKDFLTRSSKISAGRTTQPFHSHTHTASSLASHLTDGWLAVHAPVCFYLHLELPWRAAGRSSPSDERAVRASQHLFSLLSQDTRPMRSARAQYGAQLGFWSQGTPHAPVSRSVVLANAPVTRPLAEL